jgi:hypothetical protein
MRDAYLRILNDVGSRGNNGYGVEAFRATVG